MQVIFIFFWSFNTVKKTSMTWDQEFGLPNLPQLIWATKEENTIRAPRINANAFYCCSHFYLFFFMNMFQKSHDLKKKKRSPNKMLMSHIYENQ